MLTNLEKFLAIVSKEKSNVMEQIEWRMKKIEVIREQQRIELEKLIELDKNKK